MIWPHAEYCKSWNKGPCNCGMTKLMEKQQSEPVHPEPPLRCVFGWHLYRKSHGMYGDLAVDCVYCEATHYSSHFMYLLYKLTGRLVPDVQTQHPAR